jgi:hypothetical protein
LSDFCCQAIAFCKHYFDIRVSFGILPSVSRFCLLTFNRDYRELIFRRFLPKPIGFIYFCYQPLASNPENLALPMCFGKNLLRPWLFWNLYQVAVKLRFKTGQSTV